MPQAGPSKDIEKVLYATAKAMALAGQGVGTDRVVRLYVDDAPDVLLGAAKAAKRQGFTIEELVAELEARKRGAKR